MARNLKLIKGQQVKSTLVYGMRLFDAGAVDAVEDGRVSLADGKFVPHGVVVDSQEKADSLGTVPDALKHFNDEVVEVNREFAASYGVRKKSCVGN